jgi:hypothetical protein
MKNVARSLGKYLAIGVFASKTQLQNPFGDTVWRRLAQAWAPKQMPVHQFRMAPAAFGAG